MVSGGIYKTHKEKELSWDTACQRRPHRIKPGLALFSAHFWCYTSTLHSLVLTGAQKISYVKSIKVSSKALSRMEKGELVFRGTIKINSAEIP